VRVLQRHAHVGRHTRLEVVEYSHANVKGLDVDVAGFGGLADKAVQHITHCDFVADNQLVVSGLVEAVEQERVVEAV
jgi:hypothetical protein